jgi:RHS repeat-associated protein
MIISQRSSTIEQTYRYGFNNGSEKDDEIVGLSGAHFTTKYREGDTRLLRWWSVDPKADLQPWQSPYSYMDGNTVQYNDPDGDCPWCAAIAGAWEYGTQVYDNYKKGNTGYDAWIGKVDFVDVAIEVGTNFIPGGKLIKGAAMVGGELAKNSFDYTEVEGGRYIGDGSDEKQILNVLKKTAVDATVGAN